MIKIMCTKKIKGTGIMVENNTVASEHNILWNMWIYRVARIILGVVFLWSGATKLNDPLSFSIVIDAYGIVPDILTIPIAFIIAGLEVIAAIGLLADIRGSLLIISALLVLFIVILSYGIWMGLDVDCGCFGPDDPEAKAFHGLRTALYRDLIMVAGIIYLYFWRYIRAVEPVRMKIILKTYLKN